MKLIACNSVGNLRDKSAGINVQKELWYSSSHHREGGFENRWENNKKASPLRFMTWLLSKPFKSKVNIPPDIQILTKNDFKTNRGFRIWWFGHASILLQMDSINIIFDPVLSEYIGPNKLFSLPRIGKLPVKVKDLPKIDYVIISHNHYDHLDQETNEKLFKYHQAKFFVPLRVKNLLESWDIKNVYELDWYMKYKINPDFEIFNLPANHRSNRSFNDEKETLWSSWLIKYKNKKFYFAGDTGYSEHFEEIYGYYGEMDLSFLPIGAYLPRDIMQRSHLSPADAIKAGNDLKSKYIFPIHWGTFDQTDETIQDPMIKLDSLSKNDPRIIKVGIAEPFSPAFN